jgi:hypothetical protein
MLSTTCEPARAVYMFLGGVKFLLRILGCIYCALRSAHLQDSFIRFPLWVNMLAII